MGKLYRNMTDEEKEKHVENVEKYRKANPDIYRKAAIKKSLPLVMQNGELKIKNTLKQNSVKINDNEKLKQLNI